MDDKLRTKEEILNDLQELQKKYSNLKSLYDRDISESKKMARALQDNISKLDLAMKAGNLAWWELDYTTGNVIFGKRKTEMLGYPQAMFNHYKDFTDLVHPEDYEMIMDRMRGHCEGRLPRYEGEYRIKTKSGNYIWFYDVGSIVKRDSNGKPLKITGLVFEISERKAAEQEIKLKNEELRKANAEKDKFFSIIAHDLRGPIGGMMGLIELMSDEPKDFSEQERKELTLVLSKSARNVFELLEQLLEWSQMKIGLTNFNPQMIDLKDIVINVVNLLTESARLKSIDLISNIPSETKLFADLNMLQSVLRNLISNAIKYTPQGGKVTISAAFKENGTTLITVKDTGIGMNKEILENLFRIDVNTKRPGTNGEKSTGLGLLLCKDFIGKLGGSISVESQEGKGSVFTVSLTSH